MNERIEYIERQFLAALILGYLGEEAYRIQPEDFDNPAHAQFFTAWREWRGNHPSEPDAMFAVKHPEHFQLHFDLSAISPGKNTYEMMGDAAIEHRLAAAMRQTEKLPGLERAEALRVAIDSALAIVPDRIDDYEGSHEEWLAWMATTERPLTTGHAVLDALLRFEQGNLVIVAGTPSSGKSSFALETLWRFAQMGIRTEFLTLEMRALLARRRLVANISGVAIDTIARKEFGPETARRLNTASAKVAEYPIRLRKSAGWNVDRVTDRIMRSPASVIAIDYVGLVGASERKRARDTARAQQLAAISNAIMQCTVDSGKLVFLLSQLNRDSMRMNRPPEMHDLKDSGALEADAHVILGLYCPPEKRKDSTRPVQVNVMKNRDGMVSYHVMFDFHAPVCRFAEQPVSTHTGAFGETIIEEESDF